jgi:hypothetical protein
MQSKKHIEDGKGKIDEKRTTMIAYCCLCSMFSFSCSLSLKEEEREEENITEETTTCCSASAWVTFVCAPRE